MMERHPLKETPVSKGWDWILDSGAYTAWRKKVSIDLKQYATFAETHADLFRYIVNLDRIPGEFGGNPSHQEVERAANESFFNYLRLKELLPNRTNDIIPVFHQGEPTKYLDCYLKEGATYIGVSPTNGLPASARIMWMEEVLKNVPKDIKFHSFGFGSTIEKSYPFLWSMDSSSWSQQAGFGWILAPANNRGGWTVTHITGSLKGPNLGVIASTLKAIKEKGMFLPEELSPELLVVSPYARALQHLIIRRQICQQRIYAPILITPLVKLQKAWSPQYILASYFFLRTGTALMKTLREPPPSSKEILELLQPKRNYDGITRRVRNTGRLPGIF